METVQDLVGRSALLGLADVLKANLISLSEELSAVFILVSRTNNETQSGFPIYTVSEWVHRCEYTNNRVLMGDSFYAQAANEHSRHSHLLTMTRSVT